MQKIANMLSLVKMAKLLLSLADWTNFYYAYGLLAGNGGYVFGQNGKDPKDIGLANDGAIKGIEYAKSWYEKWPKGMQDTEGAGNLIPNSIPRR